MDPKLLNEQLPDAPDNSGVSNNNAGNVWAELEKSIGYTGEPELHIPNSKVEVPSVEQVNKQPVQQKKSSVPKANASQQVSTPKNNGVDIELSHMNKNNEDLKKEYEELAQARQKSGNVLSPIVKNIEKKMRSIEAVIDQRNAQIDEDNAKNKKEYEEQLAKAKSRQEELGRYSQGDKRYDDYNYTINWMNQHKVADVNNTMFESNGFAEGAKAAKGRSIEEIGRLGKEYIEKNQGKLSNAAINDYITGMLYMNKYSKERGVTWNIEPVDTMVFESFGNKDKYTKFDKINNSFNQKVKESFFDIRSGKYKDEKGDSYQNILRKGVNKFVEEYNKLQGAIEKKAKADRENAMVFGANNAESVEANNMIAAGKILTSLDLKPIIDRAFNSIPQELLQALTLANSKNTGLDTDKSAENISKEFTEVCLKKAGIDPGDGFTMIVGGIMSTLVGGLEKIGMRMANGDHEGKFTNLDAFDFMMAKREEDWAKQGGLGYAKIAVKQGITIAGDYPGLGPIGGFTGKLAQKGLSYVAPRILLGTTKVAPAVGEIVFRGMQMSKSGRAVIGVTSGALMGAVYSPLSTTVNSLAAGHTPTADELLESAKGGAIDFGVMGLNPFIGNYMSKSSAKWFSGTGKASTAARVAINIAAHDIISPACNAAFVTVKEYLSGNIHEDIDSFFSKECASFLGMHLGMKPGTLAGGKNAVKELYGIKTQLSESTFTPEELRSLGFKSVKDLMGHILEEHGNPGAEGVLSRLKAIKDNPNILMSAKMKLLTVFAEDGAIATPTLTRTEIVDEYESNTGEKKKKMYTVRTYTADGQVFSEKDVESYDEAYNERERLNDIVVRNNISVAEAAKNSDWSDNCQNKAFNEMLSERGGTVSSEELEKVLSDALQKRAGEEELTENEQAIVDEFMGKYTKNLLAEDRDDAANTKREFNKARNTDIDKILEKEYYKWTAEERNIVDDYMKALGGDRSVMETKDKAPDEIVEVNNNPNDVKEVVDENVSPENVEGEKVVENAVPGENKTPVIENAQPGEKSTDRETTIEDYIKVKGVDEEMADDIREDVESYSDELAKLEEERQNSIRYANGEQVDKPASYDYWKGKLGLQEKEKETPQPQDDFQPSYELGVKRVETVISDGGMNEDFAKRLIEQSNEMISHPDLYDAEMARGMKEAAEKWLNENTQTPAPKSETPQPPVVEEGKTASIIPLDENYTFGDKAMDDGYRTSIESTKRATSESGEVDVDYLEGQLRDWGYGTLYSGRATDYGIKYAKGRIKGLTDFIKANNLPIDFEKIEQEYKPKSETSQQPIAEEPKPVEEEKTSSPKVEQPKSVVPEETPKAETPNVEVPKAETKVEDAPKAEAPVADVKESETPAEPKEEAPALKKGDEYVVEHDGKPVTIVVDGVGKNGNVTSSHVKGHRNIKYHSRGKVVFDAGKMPKAEVKQEETPTDEVQSVLDNGISNDVEFNAAMDFYRERLNNANSQEEKNAVYAEATELIAKFVNDNGYKVDKVFSSYEELEAELPNYFSCEKARKENVNTPAFFNESTGEVCIITEGCFGSSESHKITIDKEVDYNYEHESSHKFLSNDKEAQNFVMDAINEFDIKELESALDEIAGKGTAEIYKKDYGSGNERFWAYNLFDEIFAHIAGQKKIGRKDKNYTSNKSINNKINEYYDGLYSKQGKGRHKIYADNERGNKEESSGIQGETSRTNNNGSNKPDAKQGRGRGAEQKRKPGLGSKIPTSNPYDAKSKAEEQRIRREHKKFFDNNPMAGEFVEQRPIGLLRAIDAVATKLGIPVDFNYNGNETSSTVDGVYVVNIEDANPETNLYGEFLYNKLGKDSFAAFKNAIDPQNKLSEEEAKFSLGLMYGKLMTLGRSKNGEQSASDLAKTLFSSKDTKTHLDKLKNALNSLYDIVYKGYGEATQEHINNARKNIQLAYDEAVKDKTPVPRGVDKVTELYSDVSKQEPQKPITKDVAQKIAPILAGLKDRQNDFANWENETLGKAKGSQGATNKESWLKGRIDNLNLAISTAKNDLKSARAIAEDRAKNEKISKGILSSGVGYGVYDENSEFESAEQQVDSTAKKEKSTQKQSAKKDKLIDVDKLTVEIQDRAKKRIETASEELRKLKENPDEEYEKYKKSYEESSKKISTDSEHQAAEEVHEQRRKMFELENNVLGAIDEIIEKGVSNSLVEQALMGLINRNGIKFSKVGKDGNGISVMPRKQVGTFYSNAEKAVLDVKQDKATPEQWKAMLKKNGGIKAGEDKWMGLTEWLDGQKGTVTKDDILKFVRENTVEIKEVHYGATQESARQMLDFYQQEFFSELSKFKRKQDRPYRKAFFEFNRKMVEKYGVDSYYDLDNWNAEDLETHDKLLNEMGKEDAQISIKSSELAYNSLAEDFSTDFTDSYELKDGILKLKQNNPSSGNEINSLRLDYTTKGLNNKKEIALYSPSIESWNEYDEIHFGEETGGKEVGWCRFGETTDTNGNRVLVIDEIQSNRHQEGRKYGYDNTTLKSFEAKLNELNSVVDKANNELLDYINIDIKNKYGEQASLKAALGNFDDISKEDADHIRQLEKVAEDAVYEVDEYIKNNKGGKIPAAPFENNWHENVFKRMVQYAAENGFDKIAWTYGEQQAKRYNIGDVVRRIIVTDNNVEHNGVTGRFVQIQTNSGASRYIVGDNGDILYDYGNSGAKNLSDVVGNELSGKLLSNEGESSTLYSNGEDINSHVYEGDNLRIGGEGMKSFYDGKLVNYAKKFGKKFGANVSDVVLPHVEDAGRIMHSMDVTDQMRETVMKEGLPMFSVTHQGTNPINTEYEAKHNEIKGKVTADIPDDATVEDVKTEIDALKKLRADATKEYLSGKPHSDVAKEDASMLRARINELNSKKVEIEQQAKREEINTQLRDLRSQLKEAIKNVDYKAVNEIRGKIKSFESERVRNTVRTKYKARIEEIKSKNENVADMTKSFVKYINSELSTVLAKEMGKSEFQSFINEVRDISKAWNSPDKTEQQSRDLMVKFDDAVRKVDDVVLKIETRGLVKELKKMLSIKTTKTDSSGKKVAKGVNNNTRVAIEMMKSMFNGFKGEFEEDFAELSQAVKDIEEQKKYYKDSFVNGDITKEEYDDALRGISEQYGDVASGIRETLDKSQPRTEKEWDDMRNDLLQKFNDERDGKAKMSAHDKVMLNMMPYVKELVDTNLLFSEVEKANKEIEKLKMEWNSNAILDSDSEEEVAIKKDKRIQIAINLNSAKASLYAAKEAARDGLVKLNNSVSELIDSGHTTLMLHQQMKLNRARQVAGVGIRAVDNGKPFAEGAQRQRDAKEDEQKANTWYRRAWNWLFLRPTESPESMLSRVDINHFSGEGELYNMFMKSERGFGASLNRLIESKEALKNEFDDKCKEIFGSKEPKGRNDKITVDQTFVDEVYNEEIENYETHTRAVPYEMKKGEALCVYLWSKSEDGRAKLEAQGFDANSIEQIKSQLGEDYIKLGDWIVGEYLPKLYEKYNQKYIEMYNTEITKNENYFPYRIFAGDIVTKDDLTSFDNGMTIPKPSALRERVRHNNELSVTEDAFNILNDHISEMEDWYHFADMREDISSLLSSRAFRNKLEQRNPNMFERFRGAMHHLAGIDENNNESSRNQVLNELQKNLARGAIAWRFWTATKQLQSIGAGLGYSADPRYLTTYMSNIMNPVFGMKFLVSPTKIWSLDTWTNGMLGSALWMWKNSPQFRERYRGGAFGEVILKYESNIGNSAKVYKFITDYASKIGMAPNKMFDALAVAVYGKSIHDYEYKRYKKQGYTDEKAHELALQDAERNSNKTQQSALLAYTSRMQTSNNPIDKGLTTFQTASLGFMRKTIDHLNDIHRAVRLMRLGKEKPLHCASKFAGATFGTLFDGVIMPFSWNMLNVLGVATMYSGIKTVFNSLFGDDDQPEKDASGKTYWDRFIEDHGDDVAFAAITAPLQGTALNNIVGSFISGYGNWSPTMGESAVNEIIKTVGKTSNITVNLFSSLGEEGENKGLKMLDEEATKWTLKAVLYELLKGGTGINISSLEGLYNAFYDRKVEGKLNPFDNLISTEMFLNSPKSNLKGFEAREYYLGGYGKNSETATDLEDYIKKRAYADGKILYSDSKDKGVVANVVRSLATKKDKEKYVDEWAEYHLLDYVKAKQAKEAYTDDEERKQANIDNRYGKISNEEKKQKEKEAKERHVYDVNEGNTEDSRRNNLVTAIIRKIKDKLTGDEKDVKKAVEWMNELQRIDKDPNHTSESYLKLAKEADVKDWRMKPTELESSDKFTGIDNPLLKGKEKMERRKEERRNDRTHKREEEIMAMSEAERQKVVEKNDNLNPKVKWRQANYPTSKAIENLRNQGKIPKK